MYATIKKIAVGLTTLLLLSGCSITGSDSNSGERSSIVLFEPSKSPLILSVFPSAKLNPNHNGRPSPLQLRIYQLSNDTLFKNTDFFQLLDNDTQVLANDLKKKKQMTVYPGQNVNQESIVLDRKTNYIGLLGDFRDSDRAVSTLLIAINPDEPAPLCINIKARALELNRSCN